MIGRLVVWGGKESLDSMRHIQRAFASNAAKLGIDTVWVEDAPTSRDAVTPGSTVISMDVCGKHLPYVNDVSYVLHNFSGSDELCQALETTPERLLRLQVWTTDATGEEWDTCRQFDLSARTLFEPWGSDILAEEFLDPVFNPQSREVSFVGAVWSDQYEGTELGNKAVIAELREACARRGLKFTHRTQISDEQMVAATREARLAPAFAGGWQQEHGYLPCRYFKSAAYGVLAFGNVEMAEALFGWPLELVAPLDEVLDRALSLRSVEYLRLVRDQQRVCSRYTYRESLESISRALEAIKT